MGLKALVGVLGALNKMKCKSCKRDLPDGAIFCCWCGVKQLKERRVKNDINVPKAKPTADGWRIQLRLNGQSIPVNAPTERECIAKAKAIKAGVIELAKKPENITLTAAIDRYIESKNAVLSPETIRGYRVIQRNRFPELMTKRVGEITQSVAQKAVNAESKTMSSKTVSNAWAFCNTVIASTTGTRLDVTTAQVVSEERKWLTPEQIKIFCEGIKGKPCEIVALLALSSLRRSEIAALEWSNVDLKRRIIFVRGAAVYDEHHRLVHKAQNKNKSSRREVPIMMQQLYDALSAVEDKTGAVYKGGPDVLRRQINRECVKLGLPEVGVHGLRHSFASLAASLKVPEHIAMSIGGWSDAKTMKNIYTHVAKQDIAYSQNQMADFYNA